MMLLDDSGDDSSNDNVYVKKHVNPSCPALFYLFLSLLSATLEMSPSSNFMCTVLLKLMLLDLILIYLIINFL